MYSLTRMYCYGTPILIISFFFLLGFTSYAQEAKKMGHDKLRLVWSEEFNYKGHPDSTVWTHEEGIVRNNEPQYYTKRRLKNCRVEDGKMVIEALREDYKGAKYTSASIMTAGKIDWKYGRIEARAKVPEGKGLWPAIWMKGSNQLQGVKWPFCGEIDILEYVGIEPYSAWQTLHYNVDKYVCDSKKTYLNIPVSSEYHIYGIDWDENKIIFSVDHIETHVKDLKSISDKDNPFHKPFFLLLNLAVGSEDGKTMAGKPDNSVFPAKYYVDYVRVYQK